VNSTDTLTSSGTVESSRIHSSSAGEQSLRRLFVPANGRSGLQWDNVYQWNEPGEFRSIVDSKELRASFTVRPRLILKQVDVFTAHLGCSLTHITQQGEFRRERVFATLATVATVKRGGMFVTAIQEVMDFTNI